ncbi:MAG: slipin family protein [Deltaproteobacteria bacterium]|nr:slipin family protein [Deltaproteobacteria bacterium]
MQKQMSYFPVLIFFSVFLPGAWLAYSISTGDSADQQTAITLGAAFFIIAITIAASIKIADQWKRAVVLRLGKFKEMKGPGLFFIIPVVDTIPYWIDLRVITTAFSAEKTLTRDTVPVDVDAVLFWQVIDPEKAALEVEDYQMAISWACQTALRDVIGKNDLSQMLVGREAIDHELERIIYERTMPWGIKVISVEMRDVNIPPALQDAMSMEAQAERERQARVILGDSERQIAVKFEEAAKTYQNNPTALHLRAMNMLYEGLKEKGTIVLVPSSAIDTMHLGSMAGITALAQNIAQEMEQIPRKNSREKES